MRRVIQITLIRDGSHADFAQPVRTSPDYVQRESVTTWCRQPSPASRQPVHREQYVSLAHRVRYTSLQYSWPLLRLQPLG